MATSSPKRSPSKSLLADLPADVSDAVLSHLPIRDAIKISFLSRTWRDRWRWIPDLHVDGRGSIAFVDRVLLLHKGPIRSFSLSFEFSRYESSPDHHVARWLSALSVGDPHPFRSIILRFEPPLCLNSTIFFFRNLIHLELYGCSFHDHQGFPFLETLILDLCSVPSTSDLISNCPLLRKLILTYVDGSENGEYLYLPILCVRAPNLRSLVFRGALEEFQLVSTPLLTSATIDLEEIITHDYEGNIDKEDSYYEGDCNLTEAFGRVENIEKLELLSKSLRFLGECGLPEWITVSFERLKILTMTVDFEYVNKSLSTALYLLMCSPNLEELEIRGSSYKYIQDKTIGLCHEFWQEQDKLELSKLRTMKFTHIVLAGREIQFMLFILSKALGLEKMVIDVSPEDDGIVDKSLSERFMECLRASTKAEITFIGLM